MKLKKFALTCLAFTAITLQLAAATAESATLNVGDPAPQMQSGEFIQGEPVSKFENGKAYLVEFWATWCGPCRVSIPHLNEIHQKYKDKNLVVIGQDCSEKNDALVKPFVKDMGDKMTYRVALDDKRENKSGKMYDSWMIAAGLNGIPSAFLVDTKGFVAWIGHPMNLKDETIEQVLDGKFDVKKAAAEYSDRKKLDQQIHSVWMEFSKAMKEKRWSDAMAKIDQVEGLLPRDQKSSMDAIRFNVMLGKKDYPEAFKFAERMSDSHLEDSMLQNEMAWRIMTDSTIEKPDLALAEKFAERANKASHGKDPGILDTLARAKWLSGHRDEAIAFEESAVRLADASLKPQLQKVLESYKRGELPKAN